MVAKFPSVQCTAQVQCQAGAKTYRVLKQLGPLNYRIALEETGEDVRTAHVCNLKICFPTAEELEEHEKKRLRELFQETSDEEFVGF